MWTGNVARTERHGDRLDIIVSYSNGTDSLDQSISTNTSQSDIWLSDQITAKLNQLNNLDTFQQRILSDPIINSSISIDPLTETIIIDSVLQPTLPIKGG